MALLYTAQPPQWPAGPAALTGSSEDAQARRKLVRTALDRVRRLSSASVHSKSDQSAADAGDAADFTDNPSVSKRGVVVAHAPSAYPQLIKASVVRGTGIIRGKTPEDVSSFVSDITRRGEWDPFFESGSAVCECDLPSREEWESETEAISNSDSVTSGRGELLRVGVVHYRTKSNFTTWAREFAVVAALERMADGRQTVAIFSVDTDAIPVDKKAVRARLFVSGFDMRSSDDQGTELTYLFHVDVAGWVPQSIVNLVNERQPLGILGIRKILTGSADP